MCTTNIFTTVYPDGGKETSRMPTLCSHSRHGVPCPNNAIFKHPTKYVSNAGKASSAPTSSPFLSVGQFPPSPAYTPRSGTPNNYRSGDESDRSAGYHSTSSRGRRLSGVYVNGHRVLDLGSHSSATHGTPSSSSSRRRGERVVVMEGPPSPHTPPTGFSSPLAGAGSSPSSPSSPFIIDADPRRGSSSSRSRPVIIENPPQGTRIHAGIDVVDPREYRTSSHRHHASSHRHGSSSKHTRHPSTSSHDSPSSSRHSQEDEEAAAARRRRRERRERELEQAERTQAQRTAKYNDRIAAANDRIASRPARPIPAAPRRSATFKEAADLADAVKNMDLGTGSGGQRRQRSSQEVEDEAMKQRLKDRMMPRRATVSGPRRHQVRYDDGTVRWE